METTSQPQLSACGKALEAWYSFQDISKRYISALSAGVWSRSSTPTGGAGRPPHQLPSAYLVLAGQHHSMTQPLPENFKLSVSLPRLLSVLYIVAICARTVLKFDFINLILQILSILFYFHKCCSGYVTSCRLLNLSMLQDSVPWFARESLGHAHIHTHLHCSISGVHTPSYLYPSTQMIHNNRTGWPPHKTTVLWVS